MRAVCKEAGGSDYARRVMRLLQTNLLSFSDLAPWYLGPPRGCLLSCGLSALSVSNAQFRELTWPSHRGAQEEENAAALRRLMSAGLTHTEAALLLVHIRESALVHGSCPCSEIEHSVLDTASQVCRRSCPVMITTTCLALRNLAPLAAMIFELAHKLTGLGVPLALRSSYCQV
jgi:hypothetical protein